MRKMDEMEMNIALNAMRWSNAFLVLALALWGVYNVIATGKITIPFYLLILQGIVNFFATQIGKIHVGDLEGKKTLSTYFLFVLVFLIIFGVILYFTGI